MSYEMDYTALAEVTGIDPDDLADNEDGRLIEYEADGDLFWVYTLDDLRDAPRDVDTALIYKNIVLLGKYTNNYGNPEYNSLVFTSDSAEIAGTDEIKLETDEVIKLLKACHSKM